MPRTRTTAAMLLATMLAVAAPATAQGNKTYKLPLHWNRLYDYDEIVALIDRMQRTWPKMLRVRSLGKSTEGRDLWMLTVNNPDTGDHRDKPAFYTDANIHGNEVQGAETNLYLVWYLMEHYGVLPQITELVDRVAFYVVPSVNVDARAHWFAEPHTSSSFRSGAMPVDDDDPASLFPS